MQNTRDWPALGDDPGQAHSRFPVLPWRDLTLGEIAPRPIAETGHLQAFCTAHGQIGLNGRRAHRLRA